MAAAGDAAALGDLAAAVEALQRLGDPAALHLLRSSGDAAVAELREQVEAFVGRWHQAGLDPEVAKGSELNGHVEGSPGAAASPSPAAAPAPAASPSPSPSPEGVDDGGEEALPPGLGPEAELAASATGPTVPQTSRTGVHEWVDLRVGLDEVLLEGKVGKARPAYRDVVRIMDKIDHAQPQRIDAFHAQSLRDFSGDNRLYHLPRMLLRSEAETLQKGVAQRARAIQALVMDHYGSSKPRYRSHKVIPPKVMKGVLARSNELHLRKASFEHWGLWYGPDIIRGPGDNEWFVCEDNIGYVGGMGDLLMARQSLTRAFPELSPALDPSDAAAFYKEVAASYKAMAGNDRVVLLHYPKYMTADNEEKRVVRIFKDLGIPSVAIPTNQRARKAKAKGKGKGRARLVAMHDGVYYLKNSMAKRERVGLVIIDAEPFDVDPRHASVRRKMVRDEAQYWLEFYQARLRCSSGRKFSQITHKIEQLQSLMQDARGNKLQVFLRRHHRFALRESLEQGVPGLLDAFFRSRVKLINGPGFDFLGDKELCMYMDALIRFYLEEEPILKTIPTMSFRARNKGEAFNRDLVHDVFDHLELQQATVLKRVDGRGGDSVWVGPKISAEEFQSVKRLILREPDAFIAQRYTPLSHVDGQLVDLRNLASVDANHVVVSNVLWGRGVPMEGSNGKVNISDRGFELCVATAATMGRPDAKPGRVRRKKSVRFSLTNDIAIISSEGIVPLFRSSEAAKHAYGADAVGVDGAGAVGGVDQLLPEAGTSSDSTLDGDLAAGPAEPVEPAVRTGPAPGIVLLPALPLVRQLSGSDTARSSDL